MSAAGANHGAPLPLGHFRALDQAAELRERGHMWTWAAVSDAMAVYHGFQRSPGWWQRHLSGRVASRSRGTAFNAEFNRSRVGRRGAPAEVRAEAVRRYASGEHSTVIGRELGTTGQTVIRWVRAAGVPVRDRGGPRWP